MLSCDDVEKISTHNNCRNRRKEIILHFDVRGVCPRHASSRIVLCCCEDRVASRCNVRGALRTRYADGGKRLDDVTADPQVCESRSRPVSRYALPLTEDENLARSEDLGSWVRLVPVG